MVVVVAVGVDIDGVGEVVGAPVVGGCRATGAAWAHPASARHVVTMATAGALLGELTGRIVYSTSGGPVPFTPPGL
ncbi:MAG TPA: hypothetical protein VMU64_12810 [Acidimicrobiales bacterium]|nr:hypothetical protein [Acidimicrobiales bacterium]